MKHQDVVALWDAKAAEWDAHVGTEGDGNRRHNSDPVLWRMLGDVDGRRVLDLGCGTGYLTVKLARAGAEVVGVDPSSEMVRIARRRVEDAGVAVELRVDDGQRLDTVPDGSVDVVVSNYVLMDLPDHEAALRSIARVLVPGGRAVLVFLHPCFDVPGGPQRGEGEVTYRWPRPYADRWSFDERWGPFRSDFHTFHRSLSDYWQAFRAAGLSVRDFDEPLVARDAPGLTEEVVERARWASYSVAFELERPAG